MTSSLETKPELERRVHQQLHPLAQFQELQLATTNTLANCGRETKSKIGRGVQQIAVLLIVLLKNDGEDHGSEKIMRLPSSKPTYIYIYTVTYCHILQ